jgi:hypothetical protein
MTRSMKLAVAIAMAALLVTATGAAGAAKSTNAGAVQSTSEEPGAGVARDAVSTDAARRGALLRRANLSSVSGAMRYLRAIGLNPGRVVIQRGARNYAGPNCPGARWTCASTALPIVQIARPGGANRFRCVTASCVVVQATTTAAATNTAKCIRTTGITQSCSISQTSATAHNVAIVVEIAAKMSGLTQNASSTAQITQQATGSSNSNTACVYQSVSLEGSTTATKGKPVTVTLNAHQSISIAQDSSAGGNTVQNATTAGACDASSPLTQTQTLTSRATGGGGITQNENAAESGANMLIDIAQNQSPGFLGSASGVNTAAFAQTNDLVAIARTLVGPVEQTQASPVGGLEATVNQFSHDESTIVAEQIETQCEHAQTSTLGDPPLSCVTATPPPPPYSLTQVQFGHVRKGPCCSTQGDNPDSTFTVEQSSTQDNDTHQDQENDVRGDCSTSGSCTVTQTTTVDGGAPTTNMQTGQTVDTSITCTGTSCSAAPTIVFDGSPGTGAPPATLGPYTMTAFGLDPQPVNQGPIVTSVNDPAGTVSFSPALNHSTVGNGWDTWSHGYTGDVYWTTGSTITMTLPAGTRAFYFYAEPNTFAVFDVTATAQDGTTSGPIQVQGNSGATYFGFYATGTPNIVSITVMTNDTTGFGVGEFGIAPAAAPID